MRISFAWRREYGQVSTDKSPWAWYSRLLKTDPRASDEEFRRYRKWRAATTELLLSQSQSSDNCIIIPKEVLVELSDNAQRPLRPWSTSNNEIRRTDALRSIIYLSIELDAYMNEQWAFFGAYTPASHDSGQQRFGFTFDSHEMATADHSHQLHDGDLVNVVVAPALIRLGDSIGDDYSKTRVVLVKSRVLGFLSSSNSQKMNGTKSRGRVWESLTRAGFVDH